MRERLLEQVRARLERFAVDRNPATVLDPEAIIEVTALLDAVTDPAVDLEIAQAVGWLYWARCQVEREGARQEDLTAAVAAFAPVYQARSGAVPDAVRAFFDRQRYGAAGTPAAAANRAVVLLQETTRTGGRATLDEAIDLLRRAVEATAPDHSDRAVMMSNLGGALAIRFKRAGRVVDLDSAITACQAAVEATPADHPDRGGRLSNLGLALQIRFEQTGNQPVLDDAIELLRRAVDATPPDDSDRAGYLFNLGLALQLRFEWAGQAADMDDAITTGHAAVEATQPDDPDRVEYLSNLGLALYSRFERAGRMEDLDAAIHALQAGVEATPAGHPDRARRLSNLGGALQSRFKRAHRMADLDAAITASQSAVDATPVDHENRAGRLSNLGGALRSRFARAGRMADLDAAITAIQAAADATPLGHPDHARVLSNLGVALQSRFERSGQVTDLDAAITAGQAAADATPLGHPDHARVLSNLGVALQSRFERSGQVTDLDAAITAGQAAVDATPPDHPDRAGWLSNLGLAFQRRFERAGQLADLDAAIDVCQAGERVAGAPPRIRAIAARRWGRAAASGGRWQEAVEGFSAAIELLGLVAPRSLARDDQEQVLAELGELAADGAACCVRAGLYGRAVELFEQGRGVLLGQALDTRTDLTALADQQPELAASFKRLRDILDRIDGPAVAAQTRSGQGTADATVADRHAAGIEIEQLIASIRKLDGFETFLRPSSIDELLATAVQGPVVAVAVSEFGSFALLLTSGGVEPLALPNLTLETVYDQVAVLLDALTDGPSAATQGQVAEVLSWLWDVLASPVLDRLGLTDAPADSEPWPRLWWCTSGLLSFLPVHAAGRHDTRFDSKPCAVLDRVISSFTPTIRALSHARRKDPANRDGHVRLGGGRLVAVAMPHTPGASDLPGVLAETSALAARFPGHVDALTGESATRQAVLSRLPESRWAHFACHAAAEPAAPSEGRLLLADRPLNVLDVARLRLEGAQLAFLSACSTAMPTGRLTDEAIHLASAFQLAGYQHVIATLWPIDDTVAGLLADEIYSALTDPSPRPPALAVHQTVRWLRGLQPDRPSWWASHIHNGI